jgi:hypothetical protein
MSGDGMAVALRKPYGIETVPMHRHTLLLALSLITAPSFVQPNACR